MSPQGAADKVKTHLEAKYGEKFVIEASGGGFDSGDNSTWKVVFHAASDPALRSFAIVPKAGGEVVDYFEGVRAADEFTKSIRSSIADIAQGRVLIRASVSDPSVPRDVDGAASASFAEYFSRNREVEVAIGVLTDSTAAKGSQGEVVSRVAAVVARTVANAKVYLAVVSPSAFDQAETSGAQTRFQDVESLSSALVHIKDSRPASPELY